MAPKLTPDVSLHKRNYRLDSGDCTNDDQFKVLSFEAKEENGQILLLLPPADDLDAMIGSSKCELGYAHPKKREDPLADQYRDGQEGDCRSTGQELCHVCRDC